METLGSLNPDNGNPRRISDQQLDMLKKSLAKFGPLDGFVYNEALDKLVGAHQRQKVLPPDAVIEITHRHDAPTSTGTVAVGYVLINDERFTYRVVRWDETMHKAAVIAANQHGGEFDLSKLSEWVLELDHANIDMDLLGFSEEKLANLMAPITNIGQCDEDEAPDVRPEDKRVALGDLWMLGGHRLMCGDSTSIDAIEKLMAGEKADMVFTDPPYNQSKSCGGFNDSRPGWSEHRSDHLNDFKPEDIFPIFEISGAESGYFFCNKGLLSTYLGWAESIGGWDLLVMGKENPIPTKHQKYLSDIEYIVFVRKSGAYFDDSLHYDYYRKIRMVSVTAREFGHPTEKKVAFIEPYPQVSAPAGGAVLDLFGGSGSTLIACEKTNRKCFMMELDPTYCAVILDRWSKFTGKCPIREDGTRWDSLTKPA